jgi:hypothetical protein
MDAPVEIRYAGVPIGRASEVRGADGEDTFFLPGKEPMPVGTVLHLRAGTRETPARVTRAVESSDPAVAGMQVRLIGEAEEVAVDWIPAPAPVAAKAKAGTPTPAVEVDLALMQAEAAKTPVVQTQESAAVPEAVPVAVGSSLTGALEKAAANTPAPDAGAPAREVDAAPAAPPASETAAIPAAPAGDLDIIITDTPAPVAVAAPVADGPVSATSAPETPPAAATGAGEGVVSEEAGNGGSEAATDEPPPTGEDMPTARPIAAASGRRKTTKRRRYQRV